MRAQTLACIFFSTEKRELCKNPAFPLQPQAKEDMLKLLVKNETVEANFTKENKRQNLTRKAKTQTILRV